MPVVQSNGDSSPAAEIEVAVKALLRGCSSSPIFPFGHHPFRRSSASTIVGFGDPCPFRDVVCRRPSPSTIFAFGDLPIRRPSVSVIFIFVDFPLRRSALR
jgi:hypothetical protein